MNSPLKKHESGFTLAEVLIVVTIIGIIAAIVLPRIIGTSENSRKVAHRQERLNINVQIEAFYFINDGYPTGMSDAAWTTGSVSSMVYFPEGVPTTCNQGVGWTISGTGRLDTSPHFDHE